MKLLMKDYLSNTRKEFDVDLTCIEKPDASNHVGKCRGFFAEVSGKTIGLAEYGNRLYVMLDKRAVEVDDSISVYYSADGQTRKLVIEKGADQFSVEYITDNEPISTQYYSEDEEDADFGLWLSNVLNSPIRRSMLLSTWPSSDL